VKLPEHFGAALTHFATSGKHSPAIACCRDVTEVSFRRVVFQI
jgi:hypothetical protein